MRADSQHVTPRPVRKSGRILLPGARKTERVLQIAALVATVAALLLTVNLLHQAIQPDARPAVSLPEVYGQYMVLTRAVTGIVLVIGWPLLLRFAARLLKLKFSRPTYFLTLLGILFGSATYAATFLPWPVLAAAPALPALLALAIIPWALRLGPRQFLGFWVLQGILALGLAAATVWGLESAATGRPLNPIRELPAIYRFAGTLAPAERSLWPVPPGPAFPVFSWPSMESYWLDNRANRAQIIVESSNRDAEKTIHVFAGGIEQPRDLSGGDYPLSTPVFVPQTGTSYRVVVTPALADGDFAQIYSLIPFSRAGPPAPGE